MSFNYLDDQGVIPGSGFERISGRFNGEQEVKDWLKVGANVNYNKINSDYPGEQVTTTSSGNAFFVANYIAPVYPIYVRDAETGQIRSEEHTSELQSRGHIVCRLLLEKKKKT